MYLKNSITEFKEEGIMERAVFDKKECLSQMSLFCEARIAAGKCYADACETCCINEAYNEIDNEDFGGEGNE
jgi:hypothetical protein